MAKLKEKPEAEGTSKAELFGCGGLLLLLPLFAVGLVTHVVVVASTPDLLPLWAALLIGVIGGTLWLVSQIITSGTDLMDFIVPCIITIFLAFIMLPVVIRAKENRLRKKSVVPAQVQKQRPHQNQSGSPTSP